MTNATNLRPTVAQQLCKVDELAKHAETLVTFYRENEMPSAQMAAEAEMRAYRNAARLIRKSLIF